MGSEPWIDVAAPLPAQRFCSLPCFFSQPAGRRMGPCRRYSVRYSVRKGRNRCPIGSARFPIRRLDRAIKQSATPRAVPANASIGRQKTAASAPPVRQAMPSAPQAKFVVRVTKAARISFGSSIGRSKKIRRRSLSRAISKPDRSAVAIRQPAPAAPVRTLAIASTASA